MFYELFLRSFADGNGDGIGDFKGATKRLDYLAELGITGIWLLPVMKSPSYHGYTVSDFYSINPSYGTIEDAREFLECAHAKGIKVILDMPLNHTAINHQWFLRALAGDKSHRKKYLWLERPEWLEARRHWDNQGVWSKLNGEYYYALFGPGSPDLNYENPELREEAKRILSFWLSLGFDGFRFDAAKHIFDFSTERGKCEYQHAKNLAFWKEMTEHCRKINPDAIFVSEVWDDPDVVDLYSSIFGIGFNFPLAYAIKESVMELNPNRMVEALYHVMNRYFEDVLQYSSGIFLTNHDMSRLLSYMKGDKEKAHLALSVLLTLPGIPFIYYGEELGMKGEYNEFANEAQLEPFPWFELGSGPMQTEWKAFTSNPPYSGTSYEVQSNESNSYFSKYKNILHFRKNNNWIDSAKILEVKAENNILFISVESKGKVALIVHNFDQKTVILDKKGNIVLINGELSEQKNSFSLGRMSSAMIEQ
ncbi:alpha-amylase [Kosmotoga arenicorallina S304]|uniref:Alpha-amylase n=1 Tax=Kosmotoga arenicorallina S304 TaxID=1453497 RepID=A0A182C7C3_9BACT|nr:alpha-amylase family glycosyl hydrolase [Kosmotoga arenicorallina]OAA31441.1 alpha-amylase [Kosmotoga arenicorallina S304]